MRHIIQEAVNEPAWEENLEWRNEAALPPTMPGSKNAMKLNKYVLNKWTNRCLHEGQGLTRNGGHRNESSPVRHVILAGVDVMRFKSGAYLWEINRGRINKTFVLWEKARLQWGLGRKGSVFKLNHLNYGILQCLSSAIVILVVNNISHNILQSTCILITIFHSKL